MLLLVVIVNAGILVVLPANQAGFFAAIQDKDRLLQDTPSPRIIFVGGSNLAFGIDSPKIQKELGLNVVNMGLHAQLGLRFMLDQIKPHVRANDLLVVVPEYEQFTILPADGDPKVLAGVIEVFPSGLKYFSSVGQYLNLAVGLPQLWPGKMDWLKPSDIYFRSAFNDRGDVVSHLGRKPPEISREALVEVMDHAEFRQEAMSLINEFGLFANQRGARALLMFPCLPEESYQLNRVQIETIRSLLADGLRIPIVGSPAEFTFPSSYFFDTRYHLTAEGREARTEKVIENLIGALGLARQP